MLEAQALDFLLGHEDDFLLPIDLVLIGGYFLVLHGQDIAQFHDLVFQLIY